MAADKLIHTGGGVLSGHSLLRGRLSELTEGAEIGGYRLKKQISRTLNSCVFEAVSINSEVQNRVVIKLVENQQASDELTRFQQEKALLASLAHPAIATFIESGTVAHYSFLVMEKIVGVDLLTYADNKKLSIKERLMLLLELLKVLKYAHSQLIIHNDLKPDNILITEDGFLKLLDFGISCNLNIDAQAPERTRNFTPKYAAPEQIIGDTLSVSTDVYQVGAVLQELILGSRIPYCSFEGPAPLAAIAASTALPSNKTTSLQQTNPKQAILENRSVSKKAYRNLLRGDISTIINKCLAENPKDRYQSADELTYDLTQLLECRPIASRSHSTWYRFRKFIERNVFIVVTSVAFTVVLLTLSGMYISNLKQERLATQQEAQNATRIAEFLAETLLDVNKRLGNFNELTLSELIINASDSLQENSDLPDEVRSRLAVILASSHSRLQNYDDALRLLELNTNIPEQLASGSVDDVTTVIRYAEAQYDVGNYQRSKHVIDMLRGSEVFSVTSLENRFHTEKLRAEILRKQGNYEAALSSAQTAIELLDSLPDLSKTPTFNLLGGIHINLGDYASAINAFNVAVSASSEGYQMPSQLNLTIRGNLAILYDIVKRHEDAEREIKAVISAWETLYPNRFSTLASAYNTQSVIRKNLGDLSGALMSLEKSISLYEEHFGPDYKKLISPYKNLRNLLVDMGACQRAEIAHHKWVQAAQLADSKLADFKCETIKDEQLIY